MTFKDKAREILTELQDYDGPYPKPVIDEALAALTQLFKEEVEQIIGANDNWAIDDIIANNARIVVNRVKDDQRARLNKTIEEIK